MRKIVIIFLAVSLNMCFGCSKELAHRDGSFEYPQHLFSLRDKIIYLGDNYSKFSFWEVYQWT